MSKPGARPGDVVMIAASCAVLAGTADIATIAFRKAVLGQIVSVSIDYPWMAPAAWILLTLPIVTLALLIFAALRRSPSLGSWFGAITSVAIFAMLLPYTAIGWWASALLAVGVGIRSRGVFDASPELWKRRVKVAAAIAALACLSAGVVSHATAPPAEVEVDIAPARGKTPNVLLIVLDTVRASNLGLYGYDRPTSPRIDELARRSVVFDWAVSTSSWTLPSHGSLFTGRPARETGGSWLRPLAPAPSITDVFHASGYATGAFVGNLAYMSRYSGLAHGFSIYDDYQPSWQLLLHHASLSRVDVKSKIFRTRSVPEAFAALRDAVEPSPWGPPAAFRYADDVAADFLDWQASVQDRPFFAFLNLFDAHEPYYAPDEYVARFAGSGRGSKVDRYDAAIAWSDHVVGTLLDTLQDRGVLDNTIVVVTSDHGQHLGEHGMELHANTLYLQALHVPLLIRYPPTAPERHVSALVSLQDVPATLLELAQKDPSIPGASLVGLWTSGSSTSPRIAVAHLERGQNVGSHHGNFRGDMVSAFDQRYHYIRDGVGKEELYAYREDSFEERNLRNDSRLASVLTMLRAAAQRQRPAN